MEERLQHGMRTVLPRGRRVTWGLASGTREADRDAQTRRGPMGGRGVFLGGGQRHRDSGPEKQPCHGATSFGSCREQLVGWGVAGRSR